MIDRLSDAAVCVPPNVYIADTFFSAAAWSQSCDLLLLIIQVQRSKDSSIKDVRTEGERVWPSADKIQQGGRVWYGILEFNVPLDTV